MWLARWARMTAMRSDHSHDDLLQADASPRSRRNRESAGGFANVGERSSRLGSFLQLLCLMIRRPNRCPTLLGSALFGDVGLRLDKFFELSARGSTIKTEVWAGCVAFMTMFYVMLVIPVLLNKAEKGLVFESLVTATALSASVGTFLVGVLGNAPVGITPGLRLNAYLTFGFCKAFDVTWSEAMSCCFVSASLILLLSVLGVCNWIAREVLSDHLKKAIALAMGIFQASIGFQMMGVIEPNAQDFVVLAKLQRDLPFIYAVGVFCLIAGLLVTRVDGALLISIGLIALGSWVFGLFNAPDYIFAKPCFDTAFMLDFSGWSPSSPKLGRMAIGSSVMLFVAITDIVGVQYGLYGIAGLLRHGTVPRSSNIVAGTALGSLVGSLLGAGPSLIANESSAGILEGARTGLSAVVVSCLFFCSAFMTPLFAAIPDLAAAGPLILIGAFMMEPARSIAWDCLRVSIPSFLAITLIPHSVHTGIIAGILVDSLLGMVDRLASSGTISCFGRDIPVRSMLSRLVGRAASPLSAPLLKSPLNFVNGAAGGSEAPIGGSAAASVGAEAGTLTAPGCPIGGAPVGNGVATNGHSNGAGAGAGAGAQFLGRGQKSVSPFKDRPRGMPHALVSVGLGLKESEKIERVRELLRDLGPPRTGMQASETWEINLRRALETYIQGMAHEPSSRVN